MFVQLTTYFHISLVSMADVSPNATETVCNYFAKVSGILCTPLIGSKLSEMAGPRESCIT
jgi:hypothetical protein